MSDTAAPSVAVIGAGAVGGYYGARLAQAGRDVRFLLRRDYDAVRARGLRVTSPDGDFTLDRLTIARTPEEIGPVDWVICALKATAIDDAPRLIAPCLTPDTRVLALMNGLGIEERFADRLGAGRIFGGMAYTAIYRTGPGHIHHLDLGRIVIGHLRNDPDELALAKALWDGAKVPIETTASLLMTRWDKLGWNIPFAGLGVAAGGVTTDRLVGDPGLRAAARAVMEEVLAVGNADLAARGETARLDVPAIVERYFRVTDAVGAYRSSTVIDFAEGRPLEVDAIFCEPLRRARALGLDVPYLALLTALLRALDPAPASSPSPSLADGEGARG